MSGAAAPDPVARAMRLVERFVRPAAECCTVEPVAAAAVPEPFRSLLDHDRHMTVTMERHHGGPVGLRVVQTEEGPGDWYAREIVLTAPDGRVVQFGIATLDLGAVDAATARRIRAGVEPLGRVLIDAGVLCAVGDVALVRVVPGPHLAALIGPQPTYGRVAAIAVAGRAAVELLEIVAAG